jgi:hypothetical protein
LRGFTHESNDGLAVNQEWYTPAFILEALGNDFDLDPCSPGAGLSHVNAARHITAGEDGLTTEWGPGEFAFVNPPYGALTGPFVEKLAQHGNGIALVFARPDTRWFQENSGRLSAVCFIARRVRFHKGDKATTPPGTPGAGSMLLGYGTKAKEILLGCGLGVVLTP